MADPKKGTGKKHKGSGRRLYTDENPKDTVGIKFATPADARATVAKVKKISKPFARKIQILTVGEQRAKVMGKQKSLLYLKKEKSLLERVEKMDLLTIITRLQKDLKESYQQIGDAMIAGTIDNMEKYKYMMGQAHAYLKISQDISNLLNKKEQTDAKGTVIKLNTKD